jgi:Major capsid protein N-terminus/Large eukaryotic DNA virus major capsid protein
MPTGGLIQLTKYGAQNVLLSGNPQFSYFYKVFKKYTHFALETIPTAMDGINSFSYDSSVALSLKIPRSGDLLSDAYFSFTLPDIYSKYVDLAATGRKAQLEFQWTRFVGCAAIETVGFYIGGRLIQEFTGEYLMAQAMADYDADKFEKWRLLVGDTADLTDPANSSFAGGLQHFGYPTVVPDYLSSGQLREPQTNSPSIRGKTLYVPLPFWFCKEFNQSLPLVGLQLHVCEIKITLAPLRQLYTLLDRNGFRCAPGYEQNASADSVLRNQPEYATLSDSSSQIRFFLTDININPPLLNSFTINPTLHLTYCSLPSDEQTIFATNPLSYVIRQVTMIPYRNIVSRQTLDVDVFNPISRILFVPRRTDSGYRNDFGNLTNWFRGNFPPFVPPGGQPAILQNTNSSGLLIPASQAQIIRSLRVRVDGNEVQQEYPIDFFTSVVPYRYLTGQPKTDLPIYTFELHSPTEQPAGSLNASLIKKFQIDLDVYPLPTDPAYLYNLNLYVESVNWVLIESGMGDIKYAR